MFNKVIKYFSSDINYIKNIIKNNGFIDTEHTSSKYFTIETNDKITKINLNLSKDYRANKDAIVKLLKDNNINNFEINIIKKDKDVNANNLKDVKHIILVNSNKGGVGKSTMAVNIAYSLSKIGYKTGLFDADISGPSIPKLIKANPPDAKLIEDNRDNNVYLPYEYNNVKLMSFGYFNSSTSLLRGPLVSSILLKILQV